MTKIAVGLLTALVAVFLLLPAVVQGRTANEEQVGNSGPDYRRHSIHGFSVLVHRDVAGHNEAPAYSVKPMEVLELELGTIATVLPSRTVSVLRKLTVWVEWDDVTDPHYKLNVVAKYHGVLGGRALWPSAQAPHPLKANNIQIISLRKLTEEYQPDGRSQRCVLLHEMAHAVHHQVLGANNPTILAAYRQAMERRLYEISKDAQGRLGVPQARVNEGEYFAELTCAYLNRLHYYPFTREDLKQHDPAGYKVMERAWGTPRQLEAAFKEDEERRAAARLRRIRQLLSDGKEAEAKSSLESVLADHPKTRAGAEARRRLDEMKRK